MTSLARLFSLREAAPPEAAISVTSAGVSGAAVEWRGNRAALRAYATESLPPGAVVPSLTMVNIHDRVAVEEVTRRVLDRIGRPTRVGLILPDVTAKISLVRFEKVPARSHDLEQLIRWQVRKGAPFSVEEAQIAVVPAARHEDGQEFVVSLARRETVMEYEDLLGRAGARAGLVDVSTFNVINAVLAGWAPGHADWLLVNVSPDGVAVAILRGADVMSFRSRVADTDGTLVDLVHQTAMYYEDRLKGSGFVKVLVSGASASSGADAARTRSDLQERLSTAVETVDVRTALLFTDRIEVAEDVADRLAPLAGLLLRGREVAA